MATSRSGKNIALLACAALAGFTVAAPSAMAKPGGRSATLTVTPARPSATSALRVTVVAPAKVAAGDRFRVTVSVPQNGVCASLKQRLITHAVRAGSRVVLTFAPNADGTFAGWCAGRASVAFERDTTGYDAWRTLVRARITIKRAPGFDPAPFGTKVLVNVLPPSTATVTAPGRPTRVLGLGGGIDGFINGKFVLNTDYRVDLGDLGGITGLNSSPVSGNALVVSSLVTDPLCSAPAIQTLAPVTTAAGSSLTFPQNGHVTGKLVLGADPTTLAGCSGPATGTTTLDLSGDLGITKLADLTLNATVPGVPVGGGVTGSVAIALHLKINILD